MAKATPFLICFVPECLQRPLGSTSRVGATPRAIADRGEGTGARVRSVGESASASSWKAGRLQLLTQATTGMGS